MNAILLLYCEDLYLYLTFWRIITRTALILVLQITVSKPVFENKLRRVEMCHPLSGTQVVLHKTVAAISLRAKIWRVSE